MVGATHSITRTLSTTIRRQEVVMINSATVMFSRESKLGDLPLVSRMVVLALSQGLNGTRITCMEGTDTLSDETTTVYIYGGIRIKKLINK